MKNRLPLPLLAIKEIQEVLESNMSNLWLKNPLKNVLNSLASYEYSEAIELLTIISYDFPELMDYKKNIDSIKKAEKRYLSI